MKRPRPPSRTRAGPPQVVDVTIDDIGVRGDGVATWQGRRLFVPFALTGERVKAEIVGETGDGVQARLLDILAPSAHRVAPACRHFADCGGCTLQHLAPVAAAAWKRQRVVAALVQRGVVAAVEETVTIAPGSRRRAVFAYRVVGRRVAIGFNARASGRIVDQAECPILDPGIAGLVAPLRALLAAIAANGQGGDVAVTLTETGADVCIDLAAPPDLAGFERLGAFGQAQGLARLSWRCGGRIEPVATFREPVLTIGGVAVGVPPSAFLQASAEGEAAIARLVEAGVGECFPVADLFCGIGTFALRLAARGAVQAFDGDAGLVGALERTRRGGATVRDLFRSPLAGDELARFAAVVFDPPRAGAKAQAEALAGGGPSTVVGVSCNPATFARDARILIDGGYRVDSVVPIDQFPWSAHVELVAVFRR